MLFFAIVVIWKQKTERVTQPQNQTPPATGYG